MNTETTLTLKDNVSKGLETIIKHVQATKKEFLALERGVDKAVADMAIHIKKLDSSLNGVSRNLSNLSRHVIDSGLAMSATTRASARMGQSFVAAGKGAIIASADVAQLTLRSAQAKHAADQTEKSFLGLAGAIKMAKGAAAGFSVPNFGGGGHYGGGGSAGHGGGAHSPMRAFAGGMLGAAGLGFGGPLALVGTMAGGAGMAHALGHTMMEQGTGFDSEITKMRVSGNFTEAQIEQAKNLAKQMTHKYRTTTVNENLKTIREMSGIASDAKEGMAIAPLAKRAGIIMDAMSSEHPGLKGRKHGDSEMNIVKMAEQTSNILNSKGEVDEGKFDRFINNIVKTGIAEQGLANPRLMKHIVQYMRSSRYGLDDKMYPVMGAMGADFGGNAGPMLGSLGKMMASNNKTAHASMIRLGLMGQDWQMNNGKDFQANQFKWATHDFKDAMLRKEGITSEQWAAMGNTKEGQAQQSNMVGRNAQGFNATALDTLKSFLLDQARFEKAIKAADKVKSAQESVNDVMNNTQGKLQALQAAWDDFGGSLARAGAMTPVNNMIDLLANNLRGMGEGIENFKKDMPETAKLLADISTGLFGANGALEQFSKGVSSFIKTIEPGVEKVSRLFNGENKTANDFAAKVQGTDKIVGDNMGPVAGAMARYVEARKAQIIREGGGGGGSGAPASINGTGDFLKSVLNAPPAPNATSGFLADYLKKPVKLKPGIPAVPDTPWYAATSVPAEYVPPGLTSSQGRKGRKNQMVNAPPVNIPGVGDSIPGTLPTIPGGLQAPPPPVTVNFHVSGNADEKVVKKAAKQFGNVMANKSLLQSISTQGGNYGPHATGDLP